MGRKKLIFLSVNRSLKLETSMSTENSPPPTKKKVKKLHIWQETSKQSTSANIRRTIFTLCTKLRVNPSPKIKFYKMNASSMFSL